MYFYVTLQEKTLMTKVRITIENDLGESIELKSYELGSDFDKMYKLEAAISAVAGTILTDITSGVLTLEESSFLKKVSTNSTVAIQ